LHGVFANPLHVPLKQHSSIGSHKPPQGNGFVVVVVVIVVVVGVVGKIHTLFTHTDPPIQSDELQHGKPGADSTQDPKLQSPEIQSKPPSH
jgi:hypothetical protein